MGVHGLWELLAPVGRRVSVEALSGRKLAIDASIWIVQFMKAMRDDKGDMIRNAHLLGFFRRICKLLYLRAKPVFVFDGGTPALKRRTVIARRRQREKAQSKIRKTAEKLLLNHLRTRKLDEIAQNIGLGDSLGKSQDTEIGLTQLAKKQGRAKVGMTQDIKRQQQAERSKGKDEEESTKVANPIIQRPMLVPSETSMPQDNGKSTVPFIAKEDGEHATLDNGAISNASDGTDDDNEEYFMLPPTQGHVDPAVLASLPPSMQLNLLVQMREQLVTDNRKRFQRVAKNPESFSQMQIQAYLKTVAFRRDINQVQKAAAGRGIGGIPSARIASEVDREYIFSTSFHPEKQAEVLKVETHQESSFHQDNILASQSSRLQEGSSDEGDIQHPITIPGKASFQESNPGKVLDAHESSDDKDIEWEDGVECALPASSQPVKGAVITIEIDQDELLAEGVDVQKLCPDVISESEEIEWEDDTSAADCNNVHEPQNSPVTMAECEDGTNGLISTGVDSPEVVDRTLMEIEAAELEEAIRQSLQDRKGFREPKLIIREESTAKVNEHETPPHDSIVCESSLTQEDYFTRERERKGKSIVSDTQAEFLGNKVGENNKTAVSKGPDFVQVLDHDADNWKSVMSEGKTSTTHVNGNTPQAHANSSITGHNSVVPKRDIAAPSEGPSFEEAPLIIKQSEGSESDSVVKLEATISMEALSKANLSTEETSICCTLSNPEHDGEVKNLKDEQEGGYTVQASVDTPDIVGASTDAGMEYGNIVPSSLSRHFIEDKDKQLQEALLKEAEEIDLNAEREAFAKQERDLLAKREDLARQQAELQALMEAEQAAMQTNLQEERDLLLEEEMELRATQRKNERNAESVSGEMFSECQELLQMFGLPYIIAPMEAEAQCAYMDSVGLVDGVVTDDCDVFLFGGRNVFKNIFDDRKYVETYYMKDVESELGLDQEKLIHMALLLGSDYTEGISGIGIVNAIEVVNAFEGEAGLQKFKEWLDAPDYTLLEKIHQDGSKKQTKRTRNAKESEAEDTHGAESEYNPRQQDFMGKHRAVSKNWNVPESFPNPMVISAYEAPQVDKSSEAFMWGRPDLEALRRLCLERFGWNKSKSDELLVPVLKEYDRHETQLRLEAFYSFNQRFAKIRSKRIQKAVTRGTGRLSSELVDFPKADDPEEHSPTEGEGIDSKSKSELDNKLTPSTKTSAKKAAGSRVRKTKASPDEKVVQDADISGRGRGRGGKAHQVEKVVQDAAISRRGRGRGGMKSSSERAKASNRTVLRVSEEASLSDTSSSDDVSDLNQIKRLDEAHSNIPRRRSNRLPHRTIYKFSGSEEESENSGLEKSKAGGSPGHDGSIPPSDVNNVDKFLLEPERNQNGDERGAAGADGQNGLQGQGDGYYLVMGGGFCAPEADDGSMQEPSRCPLESHDESHLAMGGGFCAVDGGDGSMQEPSCNPRESPPATEDVDINNEVNVDTPCMGSASKKEFLNNDTQGQLTGPEPPLRAVPSLRRKKRRIS